MNAWDTDPLEDPVFWAIILFLVSPWIIVGVVKLAELLVWLVQSITT